MRPAAEALRDIAELLGAALADEDPRRARNAVIHAHVIAMIQAGRLAKTDAASARDTHLANGGQLQ